MKEKKIMDCPFCGSDAILNQYGSGVFTVYCINNSCNCEVDTNTMYKENAIKVWNTRAYTPKTNH